VSKEVVTLMDSTDPVGTLVMCMPERVIVNGIDAATEPEMTVSKTIFKKESGAAADTTTAPPLMTTGAIDAKKPAG
jgi:hypothetical protein